MHENRTKARPVLIVLGMFLLLMAIAEPLHPDPARVPTSTQSAPVPQWAPAVQRGRALVRAAVAEQNLPGLSVAVGVGGDIVWAEGFGWADLEAQKPITPATRFRIGTLSTPLTSAAVGLLLDDGRLTLDEVIQRRVPEFPKKPWPVTLGQLMGHVAGVGTDSGDEGPLFRQRCGRPVEALPHFADAPLLFEPGTRYRYSKYGWILVSAAVEAAAEKPFMAFMRERIFQPVGMHATTAESSKEENPDDIGGPGEDAPPLRFLQDVILRPLGIGRPEVKSAIPDLATSYFPRVAANPRRGRHVMRPHNLSCYAGSMAFVSTPSDLVRFGIVIGSGKLLRPATVQRLQTSQRLASGADTGYGLGWDLETITLAGRETRAVGHDGEMLGGRVASLMTIPEHGIVVSVTSNISYADTASIARRVAEVFAAR